MSNCLTGSLISFKKHYFTFHFKSENCIATCEMVLKTTQHVELFKRVCDEFKQRIVLAFTFRIKSSIATREMVLKSCYIHTYIHTHTQTDIPDSRPYPFSLGNKESMELKNFGKIACSELHNLLIDEKNIFRCCSKLPYYRIICSTNFDICMIN